MNGRAPQPIPYQGSKRQIASRILAYFPSVDVKRLVEPFAGSAAMSIAAAMRRKAAKYWLNDAHQPLINLWHEILKRPTELAGAYETHWKNQLGQERIYFNNVRKKFNESHQPSDFLYLLARCVKAAIRYNGNGEFNNTPDNRRLGAKPEEMRARIIMTSALLAGRTRLSSNDYKVVLRECKPSDLIYMDPPYQGVCGSRDQRYAPSIDHREFCDELARLNERQTKYIVSYDGRTGEKTFGQRLPNYLDLVHLEIRAGRSTQATLLGRNSETFESLYLSPALANLDSREDNRPKRQRSFA